MSFVTLASRPRVFLALTCRFLLGLMLENRYSTGAAYSDKFLLQPIGMLAASLLPLENEDLLLDGDGVHAVVLLPQGVHAAVMAALGLSDHFREAVGILGNAVNQDTKRMNSVTTIPQRTMQIGRVCVSSMNPSRDQWFFPSNNLFPNEVNAGCLWGSIQMMHLITTQGLIHEPKLVINV